MLKQLISSIDTLPETSCWKFKGSLDRAGYGRMFVDNKEQKAHRVFYEACIGPIPDGMFLRHHLPADQCIGHACCNPDHLQISDSPRRPPLYILQPAIKICAQGHLMTPENTVTEKRKGHPKIRCRKCRQESWRKNAARRAALGLHA